MNPCFQKPRLENALEMFLRARFLGLWGSSAHLIVNVEILGQRVTSRHEGAVVFGHHVDDCLCRSCSFLCSVGDRLILSLFIGF